MKGFFPSIYFDFKDDKRRQINSNFTELASKYGKYPLSLPLHFFVFSTAESHDFVYISNLKKLGCGDER